MPRLLLYTRTGGYRHDSIPSAIRALRSIAEKEGFGLEATEDPASFHAPRLEAFDLVIFLNTDGRVLEEQGREALRAFIRRNRAFVGVHGAAATETDWAWYAGLVGATFKAHPKIQPAVVRVDDPAHTSTGHLPAAWRRVDEWYGFATNPRERVRVLLTLDETSYAPGDSAMGSDHPLAWCHEYDGGRSFYTGLGHTEESFADPLYLEHLVGGIRWALGRAP